MKTPARLAAAAVASAIVLTGCSTPPNAASVVGGQRLSNTEVQQVASAIATVTGADTATALRQAAYDLTLGEASRQIADRIGVTLSDADKQPLLASSQAATAMTQIPEGAAWVDAVGSTLALLDEVGSERYADELANTDISINPRYGTWDPTQLALTSSSLAQSTQVQG